MRTLSLITLILIFACPRIHADPPSDLAKQLAEARSDGAKDRAAALQAVQLHEEAVKIAGNIRDITTDKTKALRAKKPEQMTPAEKEEFRTIGDMLDKAIADLDVSQKKLDAAKARYVAAGGGKNHSDDRVEAEKVAEQELVELRKNFQTGQVLARFTDAKIDGLTVKDQMLVLEQSYDRTRLGAYMREKMEKLLSPEIFCNAAKICTNGQGSTGLSELTKTMFHDSEGKPGRERNKTEKNSH